MHRYRQIVSRYLSPRRLILVIVFALAGITALQLSQAEESFPETPPADTAPSEVSAAAAAAEEIVVRYKPDSDISGLEGRIKQVQGQQQKDIKSLRAKVIKLPKAARQQAIEALRADPRVEFVEPNVVGEGTALPNDAQYSGSSAALYTSMLDILWDKNTGSSNMVIAILDSGVNASHEDLAGKVTTGYDFVNKDANPADDFGHGTKVAGVAAANSNNSVGITGACWNCKVMPVKVIDANNATNAVLVADGIRYAVDNGAKVINLSLSGAGDASIVDTALAYAASKNVMVVSSAGNNSSGGLYWPSKYANNIGVAAAHPDDSLLLQSSNFGPHIELAVVGGGSAPTKEGGYTTFINTSYAAPVVSGAMAILKSAFPNATLAQLTNAVVSTADLCCGGKIGGGRLNAIKAYNVLAGTQGQDTVKPTVEMLSPLASANASGIMPVTAVADDNVAVAHVQVRLDNTVQYVDSTVPYSYTYDTTIFTKGPHTLTMTAVDTAGNSTSTSRTINIDNDNPDTSKPTVSFGAVPAAGATIKDTVPITATASDTSGIAHVRLLHGTRQISTDIAAPYAFNLNTTKLPQGIQTLILRATDRNGNVTEVTRNFNVDNTTPTPTPPTPTPPTPTPPTPSPTTKTGDLNGDNKVNFFDLSILLNAWNTNNSKADINKNGKVDFFDLSALLNNWGK